MLLFYSGVAQVTSYITSHIGENGVGNRFVKQPTTGRGITITRLL